MPSVQQQEPVQAAAAPANGNGLANGHSKANGGSQERAIPSFAHTVLGAPWEPPLCPGDPDWSLHVPASTMDAKDKGTADAW